MDEKQAQYVLAMYDIRGKQEFIFRDNHIKAIQGGSWLIEDLFDDYLYDIAKSVGKDGNKGGSEGIFHEKSDNGKLPVFTKEDFETHISNGYIGEIIYDGGGNFLLLFKSEEIFKKVNYEFTKKIMEKIGSLQVLGTAVGPVNFDDYKGDRKRLYEKHRKAERTESIIMPWGTLPIVQIDPRTSFPLTHIRTDESGNQEKLSKENFAKYEKYKKRTEKMPEPERVHTEKILDHLVTEKGKESLLAVVYIDGNNMGAKVEQCVEGMNTYKDCIAALREFSEKIQEHYLNARIREIDELLSQSKQTEKRRIIVKAGDETSFICNARDAFRIARNYLENVSKDGESTACAGIAVFHSHMPYSEVYSIAEQCCENAKSKMKEAKLNNACLLDFHFCQGAIGTSLEDIRRQEANEDCSLPWVIWCAEGEKEKCKGLVDTAALDSMTEYLKLLGRTNVKGLAEAARRSQAALDLDLLRIEAHMKNETDDHESGKKQELKDVKDKIKLSPDLKRKLIYDIVPVYDIWFAEDYKVNTEAENEE